MGTTREAPLVAATGLALGLLAQLADGAWPAPVDLALVLLATSLAAAGSWLCARRAGLGVAGAALVAAAYASAGTLEVAGSPGRLAAAALPWLLVTAPGAAPGGARLALGALVLVLAGPAAAPGARARPDLVALGVGLALAGAVLILRRSSARRTRDLAFALVVVLALLLLRRGPDAGWSLAFAPGAWGAALSPGAAAPAAAWVAAPVVLLAAAGLPGEVGQGRLGPLLPVAVVAWLCALGTPGLADTWRAAPLLGEVAPAALAPLGALGLCLLAGLVFERHPPRQRLTALALALPFLVLAPADPAPVLPAVVPDDLITLARPLAARPAGPVDLGAWVHGDLPAGEVSLRLVPAAGGAPLAPALLRGAPPPRELAPPVPTVEYLRLAEPLDTLRLPAGAWTVAALVRVDDRAGGRVESLRPLGAVLAGAPPRPFSDAGPWLLAALVLFAPATGRWRWLALGAVLAQGWWVAAVFLTPAG